MIAIAAVAFAVILFAFIWEMRRQPEQEDPQIHHPPPARSAIQAQLNELDHITQRFLPINEYSRPGRLIPKVNAIVIHYIGNPGTTAMQNRNYFANLAMTEETHASSNFIVCLDGAVIQCVPVDEVAYASGPRNDDTLSIELCHPDDTGEFTDETYESAIRLTALLCEKHGLTADDIIRHFDATGKECPKYYVENEDAWDAFKADVAKALES